MISSRKADIETAVRWHYDCIASEYDGCDQGLDLFLARLKHIPSTAAILDIGCGTGNLTLRLPEVGSPERVVGVDISEGVLDIAREHARERQLRNFEFLRGCACSLPFEDEDFDVVVSNNVFQLIPDQRKAFAEAVRVLRPSGRLLMKIVGGEAGVLGDFIELFHQAWAAVLPDRQAPELCQQVTVGAVAEQLCEQGISDFNIEWIRRKRRIPEADVPRTVLPFARLVMGFWRYGVEEQAAQGIEERISREVLTKASAAGYWTADMNALVVDAT